MSRIAIGTWRGHVSTTLDFAGSMLIVDMAGGQPLARTETCLGTASPQEIALRLEQLGAEVVICGAISRCLARNLQMRGIRVIPFVRGEVEEVLREFDAGRLDGHTFLLADLPAGSRGTGRCRRGRGGPHGGRGVPRGPRG